MQLVSEFLEQFKSCMLNQDDELLMALNMSDDITGWGLYDQDNFNNTDSLHQHAMDRKQHIESYVSTELESLDVFGNGSAVALVCNFQRKIILKSGHILKDDNLRISYYLVEHEGSLKIRHGHLSRPLPMDAPFTTHAIPDRTPMPTAPARLNDAELGPFSELLSKRSAYIESANLGGMLGLQHHNNSNVYWQLQGGALRGNEQYRKHLLFLKERFHEPVLKFRQPVVFRNQSLACLSAYAEAAYVNENKRYIISPLRVTYMLQETDGQWLCRHSHWSLPFADELADRAE